MQVPESGRSIGGDLPRPPRDAILGFPDACSLVPPRPPRATSQRPHPWQVDDWDQPDLSHVRPFVAARYRTWPLYVPQLELVPCGDRFKAALFVRISRGEFQQWSRSVVPRRWEWRWLEPKNHPYVVLRLTVYFEDVSGGPIGLGVEENDGARAYLRLDQENDGGALDQLDEGRRHLSGIPADQRSTFAEAAKALDLPWIDRW